MPVWELAVSCLLEWRNEEWLWSHHQSYERPNSNMQKQEVPVWSISIRFVLSGCPQGDFNIQRLLAGFQEKWSFDSRMQGRSWKEVLPPLNPPPLNGTQYYFHDICSTNLLSWPGTALTVLFVWNKNNSGSEKGYLLQCVLPQKPAFLGLYHTIRCTRQCNHAHLSSAFLTCCQRKVTWKLRLNWTAPVSLLHNFRSLKGLVGRL